MVRCFEIVYRCNIKYFVKKQKTKNKKQKTKNKKQKTKNKKCLKIKHKNKIPPDQEAGGEFVD
ncbi:hypothetical protein PU76_02745 [Escherichia coli]|nr:hypothetical protein PU76_02745 [Escherichia coli]